VSSRPGPPPPAWRLDQGLEGVSEIHQAPPRLPEGNIGPAPDVRHLQALDQLLAADNLELVLDTSLRPPAHHPSLLLPGPFNNALHEAGRRLRQAAEGRPADGTDRQLRIKRAIQVLQDHQVLQDLAWGHFHALHQV
jgi:hypothetical protein